MKEVCPMNDIHNFSSYHLTLTILNWNLKAMIKQEGNFELTSQTFVRGVNLSLSNSQATKFWMPVNVFGRNTESKLIEVFQQYTITLREQVIFTQTWYTMFVMTIMFGIICLWLKCRHMEGLSLSGPMKSSGFPHTTNYESEWSSPYWWQRDSPNWQFDGYWLYTCHNPHWNVWICCLGIVFCVNDEACHIIIKGLISRLVSSFPCNQLHTGFIWNLPLVNIYIFWQIQLFKYLI